MAEIITCVLDPADWGTATRNEQFQTEYTRKFVVTSDDSADEVFVLNNLPGMGMFAGHPSDAFARIKNIAIAGPRRFVAGDGTETRQYLWSAQVTWGYINPFQSAESGDPADCPIEVSVDGVLEEQPADTDKDGNPNTNSAGDYFDPPVTKDFQRIKINITRFEKSVNVANLLLNYALHKNSTDFQGFPMGTVKLAVPQLIPYFSQFLNILRWQVKYVFEINPDTWKKFIADRGFRSYDATNNKMKTLLDEYGFQPQEPFFLDGNGQALPLPVDKDDVVILELDNYEDADFNDFGFPEDIMQTAIL